MQFHFSNQPQKKREFGFSLIELLAVVAIMSILLTVGAVGIGNLTAGKSVPTAVANAEAVFDEARIIAVGKKTRALVLVSVDDPKNAATYLRRMIIAYENQDPVTGAPLAEDWIVADRGTVLPDQVYFSQDLSKKNHETSSGISGDMMMSLTASSGVKANFAGKYIYYEFNSEGICKTPGASFIVGTGARPVGAEKPKVTGAAKRDFGGFVIWRNGRTSIFRSAEQINAPSTLTEF